MSRHCLREPARWLPALAGLAVLMLVVGAGLSLRHRPAPEPEAPRLVAGTIMWEHLRIKIGVFGRPVAEPLPPPDEERMKDERLVPRPPSWAEEPLRDLLERSASAIDLETVKGTSKALLAAGQERMKTRQVKGTRPDHKLRLLTLPVEELLVRRKDLQGLPLLAGAACRTGLEQTLATGEVSRGVRRLQAAAEQARRVREEALDLPALEADPDLVDFLRFGLGRFKKQELLVPVLEHLFQVETTPLRHGLIRRLEQIEGVAATRALARRAVFNLAPEVRVQAVEALKKRPPADVRPVLLEALRYPWFAAARHAALALVTLNDRDAVPALRKLLDLPAPTAPYRRGEGRWFRKELVRANHLGSCLLCHPPSVDPREPIRAPIPTPGEPLPSASQSYYSPHGSDRPLVRADVVYFRQDFSAMHPVSYPDKWPAVQRFDYLVRTRELNGSELAAAREDAAAYPQREAVRYALSRLSVSP